MATPGKLTGAGKTGGIWIEASLLEACFGQAADPPARFPDGKDAFFRPGPFKGLTEGAHLNKEAVGRAFGGGYPPF